MRPVMAASFQGRMAQHPLIMRRARQRRQVDVERRGEPLQQGRVARRRRRGRPGRSPRRGQLAGDDVADAGARREDEVGLPGRAARPPTAGRRRRAAGRSAGRRRRPARAARRPRRAPRSRPAAARPRHPRRKAVRSAIVSESAVTTSSGPGLAHLRESPPPQREHDRLELRGRRSVSSYTSPQFISGHAADDAALLQLLEPRRRGCSWGSWAVPA